MANVDEKLVRAREEGMSYWDIRGKFGVPMTKAREIVRRVSPEFTFDSMQVRHAAKAAAMYTHGKKTCEEIAKELGISKATAWRAVCLWEHAARRRRNS
jgi:transposase